MPDRHKLVSAMLVLTIFGTLLLLPPLAYVFSQPISHFGLPQVVIYLFVVWLGLIVGNALLTRALPREETPTEGD